MNQGNKTIFIQGSHPSKPTNFKTELPRNQDPIDKIWTNFDKASGRQKANQRIYNDVPNGS
jgi:hypothetical protein